MEGETQRMSGKRTSVNQNSNENADTESRPKRSRQEEDVSMRPEPDVTMARQPDLIRGITDARDMEQGECEEETCCYQTDAEMETCFARTDCADRISRFPELVQDKVFGFLNARDKVRAAQVCSAWLYAVNKPCHWRNLTLKLSLDRLSEEELNSMKKKKICRLEIMTGTDDQKLGRFLQEYPSMESLSLATPSHTDVLLQTVSRTEFVSLKELELNLFTGNAEQIRALRDSLKSFPKLHRLQIVGPVSSSLVTAIGKVLQGLNTLHLHSAPHSRKLNICGLERLGNLQRLYLRGFEWPTSNTIPVLKTVKKLVLRCCIHPINKWAMMLSQMSSLEELFIAIICRETEDGEMNPLYQSLVNLRNFGFFPDKRKLWRVNVKYLAQMSCLQEFRLSGDISDEGIQALRNLKLLKTLTLYHCSQITTGGMKLIGQMSSLQRLKVCAGHHGGILLRGLGQGSCRLKRLCLKDITDTSSEDMAHIANMSSLRDLELYCVNVGPIGMELLNKGNFTLGSLKLHDCGVTLRGLMPLFEKQTTLRELKLEGKEIEAADISLLKTILPNLECVMVSGNANAESRLQK